MPGQIEDDISSTPRNRDTINLNIINEEKYQDENYQDENYQDEKPQEDNKFAEIIPITNPEIDNLDEYDNKDIKLYKNNTKEIVKLLRSISGLTAFQKRVIELRYISLLEEYAIRLKYIDPCYHASRLLVSVGSVAVPALLSIQSPTSSFSTPLFWTTWIISISVTVCHNLTSIFRFDKKFFGIHSTLERLKSEGWQYLELTGNYSGHHGHVAPTHSNQYVYFLNKIERLTLKQVEEEYTSIKEPDKHSDKNPSNSQTAPAGAPKEQIPSPLDLNINRGKKS
jgi:hypothetical protein